MCRLLAALSVDDLVVPYFLTEAPFSLLKLSRASRQELQRDGWGVGWFEDGRPRIDKSARPIYRDRAHLARAARRAKGKALVGHIRWASNPLKLPRKEIIGYPHSQPFIHRSPKGEDGWLFAHNGTLLIPREVKAALGPWAKYVRGKNDSEVLFYWLMKTAVPNLKKNPAAAVKKSLRGLDRIWRGCKKSYPLYKFPYHGLNWVLTNGRELYAFCFVTPKGFGKSKALADKHQPYYQLQMKAGPGHVLIVSEPLDREGQWRPFPHGQLVTARLRQHRAELKQFQVRL